MPIAKTGSRAKFRHERIKSPKAFDPRSFRTKRVGASRIIIGCPKGKYSPSTGRCKVGTKAQAVLRPKKRNAFIDGVVPVTKLTNGKTVLAKPNGKEAKIFANKSQAMNASIKLGIAFGIKSEVYQSPTSRRFYVIIKSKKNPLSQDAQYGVFEWRSDGKYKQSDAVAVYKREIDAKKKCDKLNEVDMKYVVRGPLRWYPPNKPSTSTISWQTWADKQEKQMRKDIDAFIEQGMNKKQVIELVLGGSTIGKPYKDRIRRDYGVNPRGKKNLSEARNLANQGRSLIIAKALNLRLRQNIKTGKFIMDGGIYGSHSIYASCYNNRVDAHWKGYMQNNGIKWQGHPEYFPDTKTSSALFSKNKNPRKKWYYGPSVTHRGKVLVFPSSKTPTQGTHGRRVKYAVGPFTGRIAATNAAKKCMG